MIRYHDPSSELINSLTTISFPGGAGGNWLASVINFEEYQKDLAHFHKHTKNKNYNFVVIHELDPTKFDYLYSGKSYFNFYLNVVYKLFHHDLNIFTQTDYRTHFLECVNTARFLCKFDQIYDHVFFNYDDLIDSPVNFYRQLYTFQKDNSYDICSEEDFLLHRNMYVDTCVNPIGIEHNFDNMFWVCFVIGQLMNLELVPKDFSIYEYQNQDECKQFALDNYQHCTLTKIHNIDTNIFMPNLL
jgi:hypothetical protein